MPDNNIARIVVLFDDEERDQSIRIAVDSLSEARLAAATELARYPDAKIALIVWNGHMFNVRPSA
jgi:hypothetical protein